jgi:hypothetical protein
MAKKKPSKPNNLKAVMPDPDPNQPNQPEWQGPIQGDPRYARMSLEELLFLPSKPLNAGVQAEVDRRVWPRFYNTSAARVNVFGSDRPLGRTTRPGETRSSPWWGAIKTLRAYPQRVAANRGLQTLLRSLQEEAGGEYHVPVFSPPRPSDRNYFYRPPSFNVTPTPRPDQQLGGTDRMFVPEAWDQTLPDRETTYARLLALGRVADWKDYTTGGGF